MLERAGQHAMRIIWREPGVDVAHEIMVVPVGVGSFVAAQNQLADPRLIGVMGDCGIDRGKAETGAQGITDRPTRSGALDHRATAG